MKERLFRMGGGGGQGGVCKDVVDEVKVCENL